MDEDNPNRQKLTCSCEKCFHCDAQAVNRLTRYRQYVLPLRLPFVCYYCGKGFGLKSLLKRHKLKHTSNRLLKCRKCGEYYRKRKHLLQPQEEHSGVSKDAQSSDPPLGEAERTFPAGSEETQQCGVESGDDMRLLSLFESSEESLPSPGGNESMSPLSTDTGDENCEYIEEDLPTGASYNAPLTPSSGSTPRFQPMSADATGESGNVLPGGSREITLYAASNEGIQSVGYSFVDTGDSKVREKDTKPGSSDPNLANSALPVFIKLSEVNASEVGAAAVSPASCDDPNVRQACYFCRKTTPWEGLLSKQVLNGTRLSICCAECRKSSCSPSRSQRTYMCTVCGKCFKYLSKMDKHINSLHCKVTDLACPICKEFVSEKAAFQSHMLKHKAELITL